MRETVDQIRRMVMLGRVPRKKVGGALAELADPETESGVRWLILVTETGINREGTTPIADAVAERLSERDLFMAYADLEAWRWKAGDPREVMAGLAETMIDQIAAMVGASDGPEDVIPDEGLA